MHAALIEKIRQTTLTEDRYLFLDALPRACGAHPAQESLRAAQR